MPVAVGAGLLMLAGAATIGAALFLKWAGQALVWVADLVARHRVHAEEWQRFVSGHPELRQPRDGGTHEPGGET